MAGGLSRATRRARPGRRLAVFLAVYLVLTGAIGWRLVEVQLVAADEYRELARRQTHREITLPSRRGNLYDRNGMPLAVTVPAAAVYANPRALEAAELDPSVVAADLAELLDRSAEDIGALLAQDVGFVYLGRQLPRSLGERVRELRLPGVGVLEEPRRTYPSGALAAQVVGFAGIDGEGLAGAELAYDDRLVGSPGLLRQERAPGGLEISTAPRAVVPAEPGEDVVLTLDGRIQSAAERLLAEAVAAHDAKGASAVVIDVASGELLAMASAPGYEPEGIADAEAYQRRNRVVTDLFEPGSVAKAVTIAAALEEGIAAPDTALDVPGSIVVGGKRFGEAVPRPDRTLTLTEVTAESSNVGAILLARELGSEALHDYLARFGFGAHTGLGLPGEAEGLLPAPDAWSATSLPTIAMGQGVSGSLLQVAGVFTTIAAGGEAVAPRLLRSTAADGTDQAPEPDHPRVVSRETAAAMAGMLTSVVEDGTGGRAAVSGYRVAGKTGTAQKPSEHERGYEDGAYMATFAGFAPADDPALVAAVMIDEPGGEAFFGGEVAAPVFADVMEFALAQRRVPPEDDGNPPSAGVATVRAGAPATGQDEP